ncbi:MAG: PH domain-containing protein [Actinobacteria bacterium]|nr:PH domain-containing protein [Actinomycetota bacterium]MCL5886961.1 PH domain-containing protein [Actinomycetota bacterium]
MSLDSQRWFDSKIDWWIAAILVILPLIQLTGAMVALFHGDVEGSIAATVGIAIVLAVYGLLVIPTRYAIEDDHLLVRFGVVRQRIRYDSILEIHPTRNLLSSAALSVDRLAIRTGRGPLHLTLISPLEREEFIMMLTHKADLIWDGQRWLRRGAVAPGSAGKERR